MESAFEGGDELWSRLQLNVEAFVNSPSGGGAAAVSPKVISRPDWEKVKAVLRGERPFSDLGCN